MTRSTQAEAIVQALSTGEDGVVGKVDALLEVCRAFALEIEWRPDGLRLRSGKVAWEDVPFAFARPSAFRAALARIAALCDEAVSPYGEMASLKSARAGSVSKSLIRSLSSGCI